MMTQGNSTCCNHSGTSTGLIRKYWNGDFSLFTSFFVFCLMTNMILGGLGLLMRHSLFGCLLLTVLAIITPWQVVGLWRSACNYDCKKGKCSWGFIVQSFLMFKAIIGTGLLLFFVAHAFDMNYFHEYHHHTKATKGEHHKKHGSHAKTSGKSAQKSKKGKK